jgi:hypothetical protein
MIRPPAVAGAFYPADPEELRSTVRDLLQGATAPRPIVPQALIVPHAGYVYSGPIAATAYRYLEVPRPQPIRRVVVLGTAHRAADCRVAASSAEGFATPLGIVPVDQSAVSRLADLPAVSLDDRAHRDDHAIETQLPFLRESLSEFQLVPLLVGRAEPFEVADVLARLWDGDDCLVVVSSDLSHYWDYARARRLDRATARLIEEDRAEDLRPEQACGARAIAGLLLAARAARLRARAVDLRNSGDTAGGLDRVVGYGAFVLAP